MKNLTYLIAFLFIIPFYGQVPAYYNDVNLTTTGNLLFTELSNKISATHIGIPYTSSSTDIWDACMQSQEDPDITSNLLLIYGYNDIDGNLDNDRTRNKSLQDSGTGTGVWNREHIFAQSLAIPNLSTSEPGPGTDVYNLHAADKDRNSERSNRPFTDGSGTSSGTATNGGWFPGDEWKGDVARSVMYMYLRYHGTGAQISETKCLPVNVGIGTANSLDANMVDLFLQWNVEDPVSTFETKKNEVLAGIQKNRNPFIDNPYLATLIWGGLTAEDKWNMGGGSSDAEAPSTPTNVIASNITDVSATISWNASSDNVAVYDYLVYVNGIYNKSTTTTSISISNLVANTTYQITVKARDASNNNSAISTATSITTLAGPLILFEEDFSNCANSSFISFSEASTKNWICETQFGENNSGCYGINGFQEEVASKDWLITKAPINFDTSTGEQLSFYADAAYGNSPLELVYSSDYNGSGDPSGFAWTKVPNITIPIKSNTSGTEEVFSFSNVDISSITGAVYFAFKYYSNGTPTRWTVDSFKITADQNDDVDSDGVLNVNDSCPNTPAGEAVNASGCSIGQLDDDNDGVQNSKDLCASTSTGESVNATGCAQSQLDDDKDGVMNTIDICSNTPDGEAVNTSGCSIGQLDDDNDGVQNSKDLCSSTPTGESVNATGCAQSQLDDDNDGIKNNKDTCSNTPLGETVNATGCAQSQLDDDNDGVKNNKDTCPNTTAGSTVDANGCFTLTTNNFTFKTVSETCLGKNNGQINITAQAIHTYKATIDGTEYVFVNNSLNIPNLQAKIYTICITITGETYKQCFEAKIDKGATISGKATQSSKGISFDMESGTPPYSVLVNNNEVLNTNKVNFSVENIKYGDVIQVKTAISCEGVLAKTIDLTEGVYAYPNPSKGNFEIALPALNEETLVEVYNMQSQLILSRSYTVGNGKIQLNIEGYPTGIYMLKLVLDKKPMVLKLIKE